MLLLIRGIPGSGKSTFAKQLSEETGAIHLEADMFFETVDGWKFQKELQGYAHDWCIAKTQEAIEQGLNVIVSNTFSQKWEIDPYFNLCTDVTVLKVIGNFGSIHVCDEYIQIVKDRWEDFPGELCKELQ